MTPSSGKPVLVGVLAAVSVALGIAESFFPLPVPGVRLGLANIGIMVAIYIAGAQAAVTVALVKSLIVPLLTGNILIKTAIGLPATLTATVAVILFVQLTRNHTTPWSACALGGVTHMAVQLVIVKTFFVQSAGIYFLLPYFSTIALCTGLLTGYATFVLVIFAKKRYPISL